jgi:RHS repeat-associated protein
MENVNYLIASSNAGNIEAYAHENVVVGDKAFELADHRGNVNVVVTDRKLGVDSDNNGVVDYYTADVVGYADYYPFGMLMPNRHGGTLGRYGFNGQEKDDEVYNSEGTSYTAEYWQYDSRLGRRWNRDPKPNPSISEYACFANNPILYADPYGDTITVSKDVQSTNDIMSLVKEENQQYINFSENGEVNLNFEGLSATQIEDIYSNDEGIYLLCDLISSDKNMYYTAKNNVPIQYYNGNAKYGDKTKHLWYEKTVNVRKEESGTLNSSKFGRDAHNKNVFIPTGKYDGMVVVSENGEWLEPENLFDPSTGLPIPEKKQTILQKPRASIVFHELEENYQRTHNNLNYGSSGGHGKNSIGGENIDENGAHGIAIKREKKWHGKSKQPGSGYPKGKNNPKAH